MKVRIHKVPEFKTYTIPQLVRELGNERDDPKLIAARKAYDEWFANRRTHATRQPRTDA